MKARRTEGLTHANPEVAKLGYPSFWRLFCFCLSALVLVWLPLASLEQVDALLAFVTYAELATDIALLTALLTAVALWLAGFAWLARVFVDRFAVSRPGGSSNLAWMIVCVPLAVLCAGQFAYATKQWFSHYAGFRLTAEFSFRRALVFVPLLALAGAWFALGTTRLIRSVTEPLLALRGMALFVAACGVAYTSAAKLPPLNKHTRHVTPTASASASAPDIFIFSLDSLAAEDAGICGEGPTRMPRLRQLAGQSSCFTRFYSVSNQTRPTTAAIETATLPWTHWVIQGGRVAPRLSGASLGSALQGLGYSTHAISATPGASPRTHGTYAGYDTATVTPSHSLHAGLQTLLQDFFPDARSLPNLLTATSVVLSIADLYRFSDQDPYPPDRSYAAAQSLIEKHPPGRPIYLWTHTWAPHAPYLPPPSTKYKLLPAGELEEYKDFADDGGNYATARQPVVDKLRLRYRESVMGADESLGRFLDTLRRLGRFENAIIVVTADHGESFERGLLGHSGELLHEAVIRIPLLIKLPRQQTGRIVDQPASQIDLPATVLDLTGGNPLPMSEGRSLRPLLVGGKLENKPVLSMIMARESRFQTIRGGHYAVIEGNHKLIYHPAQDRSELYELASDPREQSNLVSSQPQVAARLTAFVRDRLAQADRTRAQWFAHR